MNIFALVPPSVGRTIGGDILENISVVQEVITERESQLLVSDCEKKLKRRRYEDGHWDGVIHSFREVTAVQWSAASLEILEKVKSLLTQSRPELDGRPFLPPHVLDLSAEGYMRPHVDSVIASGDVVAGLSLLSITSAIPAPRMGKRC